MAIASLNQDIQFEDLKQLIENSIIEIESVFKKLINSLNKEDQDSLNQRKIEAERLREEGQIYQIRGYQSLRQILRSLLSKYQKFEQQRYCPKRPQEAIKCYDQALLIESNYMYLNNKAVTLCDLKQYEEALVTINLSLQINSNSTKGYILHCLKKPNEAREYYLKTINIEKSVPRLIKVESLGQKQKVYDYQKEQLTISPECKKFKLALKRLEKELK